MRKLKYVKLFENFIVGEVESISQIITFSLTDKVKSYFDDPTWIKKRETDMELKSDRTDAEDRIKKIGDIKYFLDDFSVYFYFENIKKRFSNSKLHQADFQVPDKKMRTQEYKSNFEKIVSLNLNSNQYASKNFEKLNTLPTNIYDLGRPPVNSARSFLIGYGTFQDGTEQVSYERFNYYCLVTVEFRWDDDQSIKLYPFQILLKEHEPGQEEVIGVDQGQWCKIKREEWERGLKPGDTDHRGFFKITSVEDHLPQ
jgi:hypothetical protein